MLKRDGIRGKEEYGRGALSTASNRVYRRLSRGTIGGGVAAVSAELKGFENVCREPAGVVPRLFNSWSGASVLRMRNFASLAGKIDVPTESTLGIT